MSIMRKDIGLIYTFDPYEDEPWRQALEDMYADGVRGISFLCPLPLAWREDGSFDFTLLDELTDEIFSIAPEAQLLPRAFLTTPDWWDARHEEELLKFDGPAPRVVKFHRSSQKLWRYEDKMYHATRNPSGCIPESGGVTPRMPSVRMPLICWNVTGYPAYMGFIWLTAPAANGDSSGVIPTVSLPMPTFPVRWSWRSGDT